VPEELASHQIIGLFIQDLDKEMLEKALCDDCWDEIFQVDDVNVSTKAFTFVMQHIMDAMISLKMMRIKRICSP